MALFCERIMDNYSGDRLVRYGTPTLQCTRVNEATQVPSQNVKIEPSRTLRTKMTTTPKSKLSPIVPQIFPREINPFCRGGATRCFTSGWLLAAPNWKVSKQCLSFEYVIPKRGPAIELREPKRLLSSLNLSRVLHGNYSRLRNCETREVDDWSQEKELVKPMLYRIGSSTKWK